MERRPLTGVRIIDFTNAVAGPIATFILADLGAEVIKVEEPSSRPLHAAGTAPLQAGAEDLSYNRVMIFNELNHGKRGISLNVATERGREVFLKLVAVSDAVVDNFAPRVMPNLKLDYAHLKQVKADIISVSMPAFGLSGQYRERVSYGPGVDAMSGLSHLTGYSDGPPMKPGNFFCDQNAGILSAYATMAALRWRNRTGEGQHIEMPMIDGEFQILGDAYIDFSMNGRQRHRTGNDHPWMAPHNVYPALEDDSWVAIAVETDAQWAALCEVIGQPELASDARFGGAPQRWDNRKEADGIISTFTRERPHIETERLCQAAGVPAAAVLNAKELLSDEHVRAREGLQYVDVPAVGPTPYPRIAFRMSGTPVPISKAAPKFAEDNDYVYRELLGLSSETIRSLQEDQIITSEPVAPGGRRKGH